MVCNLGSGLGYSVKEMITAAKNVTRFDIPVEVSQNRPGDPAKLVADIQKARNVLHWEPQHTSIEEIIETAWKWHRNHPNGYADK
jgi:UDP-glucose 4-epimerase